MSLTISQILFIGLLILIIYFINKKRNVLLDRFILTLFIGIGIFSVLFPDLISKLANSVGIGRGTDLVFYLFMLGSIFAFIYFLGEINKLKNTLTKIVRGDAVGNPKEGKSPEEE